MVNPKALLGMAFLMGLMMMANQSGSARSSKSNVLEGVWGGDRLQLAMNQKGGKLESDCASGAFAGPLKLAKDGSFTVRGTYIDHQPGPQKGDVGPSAHSAHFHGRLQNGVIHLSITPDGSTKGRQFALRKDAHIKLIRCY
jgi:hypothetical protein